MTRVSSSDEGRPPGTGAASVWAIARSDEAADRAGAFAVGVVFFVPDRLPDPLGFIECLVYTLLFGGATPLGIVWTS